MVRENSLRGRVILRWKEAGKKDWGHQKTIDVCIEVEGELTEAGLNRTPKFSRKIRENDLGYIRNWVQGCHFDWINPRWMGRALKRLALTKEKVRKSKGIEVILDVYKAQEKIKMFK